MSFRLQPLFLLTQTAAPPPTALCCARPAFGFRHIGLGCAVENMILATQAEGFDVEVSLLPDSKYPDHVAHLALTPAQVQGSDLFPVIPSRHTNRGPYDLSKSVGSNVLDSLATLSDHDTVRIFWFAESAKRDQFGKAAIAAAEALI